MKEKFKESPISWMVSANLIVPPKCKTCLTGLCNKVSKTLNGKNEFWHCSNTSYDFKQFYIKNKFNSYSVPSDVTPRFQ